MAINDLKPDYCLVQLSAAGIAAAEGMPVRASNGVVSVLLLPGQQVKVARYEWDMLLKDHYTFNGHNLFELVPPAAQQAETHNETKETP